MTYDETLVIMGVIKTAYPQYYRDMRREDAEKTVALWSEALAVYPAELVTYAVKRLIRRSPYPPLISDVIQQLEAAVNADDNTDMELWNALRLALSDSLYHATERYAELPPECREFAGSPSGLRELAMSDINELNTVIRGIFFKQIPSLRRRIEDRNAMSPEVREIVSAFTRKNRLHGGNSTALPERGL